MPDYSGYAPRQQQQDPNLAAWAQIGGNIANIFGLDPAKAAEARRGIQQEDYNELRNQAQIRQQLANKRVGELLGGKGFDPARGEFVDPVAYQEFVQAMADLGDARQAVPFGPGRWNAQQQARIDADNRSFDYKAGVQAKRDEKEAAKQAADKAANEAKSEAKADQDYQDKLRQVASSAWAFGNKGRYYDVDPAINKFDFNIKGGAQAAGIPAFTGGFLIPDPNNPKNKIFSPEFSDWLKTKAQYNDTSLPPEVFSGKGDSSTALQNTANQIAMTIGADPTNPQVLRLAKQLMVDQFKDTRAVYNGRIVADGKDELKAAAEKIAADANSGVNSGVRMIIVRKVVRDKAGRLVERFEQYDPDELIVKKDGKFVYDPSQSLGQKHPEIFFNPGR
jgi:hypothetical protein